MRITINKYPIGIRIGLRINSGIIRMSEYLYRYFKYLFWILFDCLSVAVPIKRAENILSNQATPNFTDMSVFNSKKGAIDIPNTICVTILYLMAIKMEIDIASTVSTKASTVISRFSTDSFVEKYLM